MASYSEAVEMRNAVFDDVMRRSNMRPRAVGVMPLGNKLYAVKVTLPAKPTIRLPGEIGGIPVRYDIEVSPAEMAAGRFRP